MTSGTRFPICSRIIRAASAFLMTSVRLPILSKARLRFHRSVLSQRVANLALDDEGSFVVFDGGAILSQVLKSNAEAVQVRAIAALIRGPQESRREAKVGEVDRLEPNRST